MALRTANIVLLVGLGVSALGYTVYHRSGDGGLLASVGHFVGDVFFPLEDMAQRAENYGRDLFDKTRKDGDTRLYRPACVVCPSVYYDRRSTPGVATPADARQVATVTDVDIEKYGPALAALKAVFGNPFLGKSGGAKAGVWRNSASAENMRDVPVNRVRCTPVQGGMPPWYHGIAADPLEYIANVLCGQHQLAFIDYVRGVKTPVLEAWTPSEHYNRALFGDHSPFLETMGGPEDIPVGYHYKQQNSLGGRLGARRVFIPPRINDWKPRHVPSAERLSEMGMLGFYYPQGSSPSSAPLIAVEFRGQPITKWTPDEMRRYCQLFLSGAAGPWQYQPTSNSTPGPTGILNTKQ